MQIAIDETGNRVFPYKNGRAICQLCGGTLIAHCGEIRRNHHWQHFGERDVDCDSWKEPETEWHRAWKERFPKEWREVVMANHRADVKTPFGLVLEFQNSPISPAVIREREEFYDYMYWIINATDFDENLVLRSKVTQNLRRHDEETMHNAREALRDVDREISEAESLRNKRYKDIGFAQIEVNSKKREIEGLRKNISESRKIARNVAMYAPTSFSIYSWGDPSLKIAETVDKDLCMEVGTRIDKQKNLEKEILQVQTPLKTIYGYPDFNLVGAAYKVVPYKDLNSQNYHMASPVLKSTMNQLFPEVKQFVSETDFLVYYYKQTDFVFLVDLRQRITELEAALASLQNELETVSGEIEDYLDTLENNVLAWLGLQINQKIQELEKREADLGEIEDDYQYHKQSVEYLIEEKPIRRNAIMEELENERRREKGKIMQDYKGQYTLTNWKYERRSWQAAGAALHFDTGKGYLFFQTSKNEFKKITVDEFVSEILSLSKHLKK